MKKQEMLKVFLGMILFFAVLSVLAGCSDVQSQSGKRVNSVRVLTQDSIIVVIGDVSNASMYLAGDIIMIKNEGSKWMVDDQSVRNGDSDIIQNGGRVYFKKVKVLPRYLSVNSSGK